ncbi:hypothetical protein F4821DRAFT_222426 [Hypoxylon rubiginosum]|uniref:Uncharacterized protein n=1 Tax=Hypoxylon rubiginosum TaxID=110542 RepID=A0ACC0DK44_9PEZI|nr:hypothetical protein F4821DRAFT_222426 [Hypoxylon rubiginosum]
MPRRHQGVVLLLRLIRHGHIIWIWKSGIVFSLFTYGRKGFLMSCLGHLGADASAHDPHLPNNYVWAHLNMKKGFECSKLEVVT